MENQTIIKAEAAIDAKVNPADKEAYNRIVLAGMKVMFSKETHQLLIQGVKEAGDPVAFVTKGIVSLMGILFKESRATMPIGPMIYAGQSLLMEALDFMEQTGLVKINNEIIATATQDYLEQMMDALEELMPGLADMMDQSHAVMQDPQKMAQYNQQQPQQQPPAN
ncbi:MAG: hypothetical protein DDT21_02614 [Syntrophomonadaceae bacterium]|nr:hypothetical protein [Bacillota bacterium]